MKDLSGPLARERKRAPKGRFLICLLSGISTAHVGTAALGCPPCFAEALSTAKGKSKEPALSATRAWLSAVPKTSVNFDNAPMGRYMKAARAVARGGCPVTKDWACPRSALAPIRRKLLRKKRSGNTVWLQKVLPPMRFRAFY